MPLLAWLFATCLLFTGHVATADTLVLSDATRAYDLLDYGILLHDPTGTLSAAEALATANPDQPRPPLRLAGGCYWLIVTVYNQTTESDWVLRSSNILFNAIDFYRFSAGQLIGHERVGRTVAQHTAMPSIELAYHLAAPLSPGQSQQLVLRLEAQIFNQIIAELMPTAQALHNHVWRQVLVLTVFGIILALVLYNFFLALSLRSDAYLWYSLHGSCLIVYFLTAFGLMYRLFGYNDPALSLLSPVMLGALLFSLLFHYRFLDIPALSVRWQRGYSLLTVLIISQLLLYPWLSPLHMAYTARLSQLLVGPFILASVASAVRRGFYPARYVLVGWGVLITVSIWGTLTLVGVFRFSLLVTTLVLVATAFEMITLSLALGDRIRRLQRAKVQAEEQVQANTLFIATLSHEVRNPLAAIMGLVTLLSRTRLNRSQRTYLHHIDHSGHALLDMLDSLLEQFRQHPSGLHLQQRNFALQPLVTGALDLYQAAARSKQLRLSAQFDPTLPPFLCGDAVRLRQVLLNLLGNAVKYSLQGQVTVVVQRVTATPPQVAVQFAVTDSGPGFQNDDSRLLQPFYRQPAAVDSGAPGVGLGLAVCRSIVTAMGGTLEWHSRPGQGSTFQFTLTFTEGYATTQPAPPTMPVKQLAVLLADDDPLNRDIIQRLLEQDGQHVSSVASGEQALALLAGQRFDLVLLDLQMPGLDGLATTRRIRQNDPDTLIVGITASNRQDDHTAGRQAGMEAVLLKPLDCQALYRLVADHMTRRAPIPAPLIDTAITNGHRQALGDTVWNELLAQFCTQTPHYLDELAAAVGAQQPEALRNTAHRLAGMADSLGFARLAAAAAVIEQEALQQHTDLLPALAALTALYTETVTEISAQSEKN